MATRTNQKTGRILRRRGFLKVCAVSGGAAACGPLLAGCGSPTAVPSAGGETAEITLDLALPENQSLAAVGGTLTLEANDIDPKGILLYRSGESSVLAFSRNCPHQGCAVEGFRDGVAACPCHRSEFDAGGNVLRGPADKPLAAYGASLSGTVLTIRK
ncbi:MAG: Rieske 2Fe-2S domain-containing protein [Anaerolineales bacterium]|nr:Rieske 2Fe-2S domain-containing protein [Anaerolineales bacterium]